ncbi:MAG TPA: EF-hand domain-containing protein [Methylocystis sp.]|nr:EF-hand domain-containing protein [Methylocystis sp.]
MRFPSSAFALAMLGFAAMATPSAGLAQSGGVVDRLVSTANEWGGQGGAYTCAQWRAYAERMYRIADPRHRGYFEEADFERLKMVSPVFAQASFDFFETAVKGRVTKKEFLETENPFFAYFDRKRTCHVTQADIRELNSPKAPETPQQRQGRGGGGGGMGPGSFGWRN